MGVVSPGIGERRQLAAELDDVSVAIHPIIEDIKLVADRFNGGGGRGLGRLDEGSGHGADVRAGHPVVKLCRWRAPAA